MREIEIIPEKCKGENPEFAGCIMVKAPKYSDHMKTMASVYKHGDWAGIGTGKQLEIMAELSEKLEGYIVSVNLKSQKDGKEYKTAVELLSSPECYEIVTELTTKFMAGFKIEGEAKPS